MEQAAMGNVADLGAALQGAAEGGGAPQGGARGNATSHQVQSLDFILDIPLKVTVELGRSKMAVRDILQLSQGSVVELSKFAGEPREVVVVNEKFGIRLTDIISPVERIEQLK
jgi:flagellar motor switch protein FliN/FliY